MRPGVWRAMQDAMGRAAGGTTTAGLPLGLWLWNAVGSGIENLGARVIPPTTAR